VRFRRLTQDELFALETEFKQFLIIHELYDEEWRILAQNSPEKAEQFIELFSDLVFLKVFEEVSYLVHFTSNLVSFFDVREEVLKAYHFKYQGKESIANETELQRVIMEEFDQIEVYSGTKKRTKEKADEVFDLVRKGSEICSETLFSTYTRIVESVKK
jgi:hypothetical protein